MHQPARLRLVVTVRGEQRTTQGSRLQLPITARRQQACEGEPPAPIACPAPCTSPPGATSWAQCAVSVGPSKGHGCGYLPPAETIAVPCPSNSFASPGATYLSNCTVSTGADRGRSVGYLPTHDARGKPKSPTTLIGYPCVEPCTSPQGATSWTQCTLNSGPHTGRSCGYRNNAGDVLACPPNSTAPVAATEAAQCRCNEGHFDNNTAVAKVSCQTCAVCAVGQYQAKACGAVDSTRGADAQCQDCPAHAAVILCDDDPASISIKYGATVSCAKYKQMGLCAMVHRSPEPWCNRTCGYCRARGSSDYHRVLFATVQPQLHSPPPLGTPGIQDCLCEPGYDGGGALPEIEDGKLSLVFAGASAVAAALKGLPRSACAKVTHLDLTGNNLRKVPDLSMFPNLEHSAHAIQKYLVSTDFGPRLERPGPRW